MLKTIGACVVGLLLTSCRAQESVPAVEVQREFSAEGVLRRPVDLPDDVLVTLRADERVRSCILDGETDQRIRKEWFGASQIDLNSDNRVDLVIVPINACLFGANLAPYWVFHNTEAGHVLVLSTNALTLNVLETKTHDFSDVEASAFLLLRAK